MQPGDQREISNTPKNKNKSAYFVILQLFICNEIDHSFYRKGIFVLTSFYNDPLRNDG